MSPYEVLVAEMLLQRTAAAGVARAYHEFFDHSPSWAALSNSPIEDIQQALKPLGLRRQKAQALRSLAQTLQERGGVVSCSRAELERLPGIGPYTVSAVLAMVYGHAEPLVDVNMARLLTRFCGSPAGARGGRRLYVLAHRLVSGGKSLQVNWAALDFGALVCRARYPLCSGCPLQTWCPSFTPPGR